MANGTYGNLAQNDTESDDFGGINPRKEGEIINFREAQINKTVTSSIRETVDLLRELEKIDGKLKYGSSLERGVEKFLGKNVNIDDLSGIIRNLESLGKNENENLTEQQKEEKEEKTSYVLPKEKIDELVADYEKHVANGLTDKEALDKIYKDNKSKISSKEIENFLQKQRQVHQEKIRATVEEKASKIAEELVLKNKELVNKEKVKEAVKEAILREKKISEEFGKNQSTKEIDLELENFSKKNRVLINEVKVEELGEKIKAKIYEENPRLNEQQKDQAEDYVKFIKEIYASSGRVDKNIGQAIIYAQDRGLGEAQVNIGAGKLESFTALITNQEPLSKSNENYKSLIEKIDWKLPTEIKECGHLDELFKLADKSGKFTELVESAQKIFYWKENLETAIVKKLGLDKLVTNVVGKIFGPEFVENSLVILSQKSLQEGSFIILQSFIGGGAAALSVTAAVITKQTLSTAVAVAGEAWKIAEGLLTAAQAELAAAQVFGGVSMAEMTALKLAVTDATLGLKSAELTLKSALSKLFGATSNLGKVSTAAGAAATKIGTAAATGLVPVVGQILLALTAVLAVLKPFFDKIKGFLSDMGLNLTQGLKDFLNRTFGVVGQFLSFVINLVEDLFILAGTLSLAVIGAPLVIFILIGLLGYNTMQGNMVSTLVPPAGKGSAGTNIPVTPRDPNAVVPDSCPSGWPTKGNISQGPDNIYSHGGHQAIDIGGELGTPVYATSKGVAGYYINDLCGTGLQILSKCEENQIWVTYCHMVDGSLKVNDGATVEKGDIIGYMDDSGYTSTDIDGTPSNHLHYEVAGFEGIKINTYLPYNIPSDCGGCYQIP